MRELKSNEIDGVTGGILFLILGAIDVARDNHAMDKATDICGAGNVKSVDTKGLTGVTVTCK